MSAPASTSLFDLEMLELRRLLSAATSAGEYWRAIGAIGTGTVPSSRSVKATTGWTFDFSRAALSASLPSRADAAPREVLLPTPEGRLARFHLQPTTLLSPEVAAANGDVATFRGVGVNDASEVAQFDLTVNGFHGTVVSPRGTWKISPLVEYASDVRAGGGVYAAYFMADAIISPGVLICDIYPNAAQQNQTLSGSPSGPTGPTRYQMRLAVAANGEWTAETGGTQASGFAAIVSAVNAADLLYTIEFSVGLTLVSGQQIVYTNPATDPYTNANPGQMLFQNQSNLDAVIGSANYDVGHVFTRSEGDLRLAESSASRVGRHAHSAEIRPRASRMR
jgi:hypothetical protein